MFNKAKSSLILDLLHIALMELVCMLIQRLDIIHILVRPLRLIHNGHVPLHITYHDISYKCVN